MVAEFNAEPESYATTCSRWSQSPQVILFGEILLRWGKEDRYHYDFKS